MVGFGKRGSKTENFWLFKTGRRVETSNKGWWEDSIVRVIRRNGGYWL